MSRKIVITGASSDIGIAIAESVAVYGDELILHCNRNPERLKPMLNADNLKGYLIQADFNDPDSLEGFCRKLPDTYILVNAAACTITGLLASTSDEQIYKMLNVNVVAMLKICRTVIPGMLARRRGRIINISSVAARRGNRGQSIYAGTKGFIESFTRSMAAEYGSRGIRINCVAPGPIDTGSLKELMDYAADDVKNSVVSGRLGRPEDVARAVAFLCSEEADFINGATLAVDGGFCRGV